MNNSISLSIRMFGAFRIYQQGILELDLPMDSTVALVKKKITETLRQRNPAFGTSDLVEKSVLADNQRILADDEKITGPTTLAILPPVCGG